MWKKARPVPHALYPLVDAELERWIKEGIAEPVETSNNSGWATPLVVVPKPDGRVRLAADYRVTVNPQLETIKYPLPSPEELFARIRGKRFAKLDLKDAYLQMELSEESKDLTTVTTHRGLLRMNRLPFGLPCCGDIFQAAMARILEGLHGCVAYLDDLLVMGDSTMDMINTLDKVLGRRNQTQEEQM